MKRLFDGFLCVCLLTICGSWGRAQQQPAQETPPQPPQGPVTQQPPPLPPRPPDVFMPDEGKISVGLTAWFPTGQPVFDKGKATTSTTLARLDLQGKPKVAPGAEITIPGGGHNAMRISYFRANAAGNFTAPTDLNLWSGGFVAGDYLSTSYHLQNVKFSYEFLTWPFPVRSRRFRLKTLWQVQYTSIKSAFDTPLNSSGGVSGSKWFISPALGIGVAEYVSRNFRLEANASGFAIPSHTGLWDANASAAYRVGKLELRVGGRGFHFKTSVQRDYYMKGNMVGAFAGIRYFLD